MRLIYRVKLTPATDFDPADQGFVVTFPEWGYGVTQGDTTEEALAMAEDVLATMAADVLARGKVLPPSVEGRLADDERRVALPMQLALKASLLHSMHTTETNKVELARRLQVDEREVRRMLDPKHATSLRRLEEGLRAFNRRAVLEVTDAA